jgi:hypothetical protein
MKNNHVKILEREQFSGLGDSGNGKNEIVAQNSFWNNSG